jgi:uncharacterized ferredoxin-like protein
VTSTTRPPAGFDDMRIQTLRHVAGLCAAGAMTAPKSGGQFFLRGAAPFIETVWLEDWYPPVYDCGACGYATCSEFLDATTTQRKLAGQILEFAGPTCNLRDIDLGVAVGSATKTASINNVDCRCQTRVAVAARHLNVIGADVAVALSLSLTHKAEGFDRPIPVVDFEAAQDAEPFATGLEPRAAPTGARSGGRHRQTRSKGART